MTTPHDLEGEHAFFFTVRTNENGSVAITSTSMRCELCVDADKVNVTLKSLFAEFLDLKEAGEI